MKAKILLASFALALCISGCMSASQAQAKDDNVSARLADSWVKSWCETIVDADSAYARLSDDYSTYQVMLFTDYNAEDYKDLSKEVGGYVGYFNKSALKDRVPITTMYVKCLGKDDTPLAEFVFSRKDINSDFDIANFMWNIDYIETYMDVLGGN